MPTTRKLRQRYGGNICRRCIMNETHCWNLEPKDCVYLPGRQLCPACGWNQHIVRSFKLSGKIKLIGK